MKNKTKLVVALASLLAVTGGVGAYSTFAWFTVNRAAEVNVTNLVANSKTGDLQIVMGAVANGGVTPSKISDSHYTGDTTSSGSDGKTLYDVSGDGKNFYRPVYDYSAATPTIQSWNTTAYTANSTDTDEYRYFLEFTVEFKNLGTSPMTVYLNDGTAFTSTGDAAKGFRMAILDSEAAIKTIWQYGTEDSVYQYVSATTTGEAVPTYTDYASVSDIKKLLGTSATANKFTALATAADVTANATAAAAQKVCDVAASLSTTMTFRFWMEGTSKWCVNTIKGQMAAVTLKFVGI